MSDITKNCINLINPFNLIQADLLPHQHAKSFTDSAFGLLHGETVVSFLSPNFQAENAMADVVSAGTSYFWDSETFGWVLNKSAWGIAFFASLFFCFFFCKLIRKTKYGKISRGARRRIGYRCFHQTVLNDTPIYSVDDLSKCNKRRGEGEGGGWMKGRRLGN